MRMVRYCLDEPLPDLNRPGKVAPPLADVSEIQVRGGRARIDFNRLRKRARCARRVASAVLRAADLVVQEAEDLLVVRAPSGINLRNLLAG